MLTTGNERAAVRAADATIDFFAVDWTHRDIHARLENWATWCHGSPRRNVAPGFESYRTPQHWHGLEPARPVDTIDAGRIAKGVAALPAEHRCVVQWYYVQRWSPGRATKRLGMSRATLRQLLTDGRQMLINRRV